LKQQTIDFRDFMRELELNEMKREGTINQFIDNFNANHLPSINEGYEADSIYYLQPLSIDNEVKLFGHKIYSHRQLGEFLYPQFKSVLQKRALQITALKLQTEVSPELFSKQEVESINARYKTIRTQYKELDPERIRLAFFASNEAPEAESAISNLEEIYALASKAGGSIKFIQPLEHGLQVAVDKILENYRMLSFTEIYNIYGTVDVNESEFVVFTNYIRLLNEANKKGLMAFLNYHNLTYDAQKLDEAVQYFEQNKLIPSIGSDATGRSSLAPGMGFVLENSFPKYQRKYFKKRHHVLPDDVSSIIFDLARIPKTALITDEKPVIICLGKVKDKKKNMLGDEKIERPIYPARAWEYLNPSIKNSIFILIGFIPAYIMLGVEYALLWLVITGMRNMFVDVISGNGFMPNGWHKNDINWMNVSHSLFWTGFSVPILSFVKARFDITWTGPHEGALFELTKFFCINISNGIYLSTHNYLRGFDKRTSRANFFRSIIAWPLAATFSPIGNSLMIPSIVQAKFWSDFVAAIIEGSGKYQNIFKVKDQIISKLMPVLICEDDQTEKLAMLDMIYFLNNSTRAQKALQDQLIPHLGLVKRIKNKIPFRRMQPKSPFNSYFELKKRMNHPNSFNELIDFVIKNYRREESLYLTSLVSKNYGNLQKWLNRLEK
ncbi:MAG: hypothetical protein WCG93_16165, partial [Paludibacter sp.]